MVKLRPKAVAGFVCRLLLFYGLLIVPWPGLQRGYSIVFAAGGNLIFRSFWSEGLVRFRSLDEGSRGADIEVVFRKRGVSAAGGKRQHSRLLGYLPTAEVVALILATPGWWSRRWKALLYGLLLVNAFVAVRVGISLFHGFTGDLAWALYRPGPFWGQVLDAAVYIAVKAPTISFMVPVFIWILVSFGGRDTGISRGRPANPTRKVSRKASGPRRSTAG